MAEVKPKDTITQLQEEAVLLGYDVKEINKKAKSLSDRFILTKTVNNVKYNAVFTGQGKIIGVAALS